MIVCRCSVKDSFVGQDVSVLNNRLSVMFWESTASIRMNRNRPTDMVKMYLKNFQGSPYLMIITSAERRASEAQLDYFSYTVVHLPR